MRRAERDGNQLSIIIFKLFTVVFTKTEIGELSTVNVENAEKVEAGIEMKGGNHRYHSSLFE